MVDNLELENLLIEEFGVFDFDIKGNLIVLQKLCELCDKYQLKYDELVANWVSYSISNNTPDINEESLKEFEKKKLLNVGKMPSRKSSTPYRANTYTANTINHVDNSSEDEEDMLCAYASTPQSKEHLKRLKETPEDNHRSKRLATTSSFESSTPSISSSVPLSPFIATPSAKYENRTNKGDIVVSYGISEQAGIDWKGSKLSLTVKQFNDECNVRKPYKHMFQKLQEKADVLNDMINTLSNEMKENLSLGDYESITTQNQEDASVCGRICCDSVGRMNSKSVVIEGSRETSGGHRIPIDLTTVKNYSLFPGQIVAIQGRNMTGSRIFPSSICMGTKLPFYCASKKDASIDEGHLTVYIACGPYAMCDETLSYTPLYDLLGVVAQESPDLLIMLGPFVDSKQPLIEKGEIDELFEDLFQHCLEKIHSCVKQLKTKVLCVPSQRDVFHHFVYPQPPFHEDVNKSEKIKMFSDPCTLMINDVCFGVTSTDILFHLGGEEVSSVRSDRLGRLAGHLLLQQCYYPLHPTSQDVNLDYERFENYGFMPVTPDVLIVPSDLRYFVKDVEGCLVINPGRLVKGQASGTFTKLLIKPKKEPNTNKSSVVTHSIAQVVRI